MQTDSAALPLADADDVRALLARRRITTRQIAAEAQVSDSFVSHVLHGRKRSARVAAAVSRLTGRDACQALAPLPGARTRKPRQGPPAGAEHRKDALAPGTQSPRAERAL